MADDEGRSPDENEGTESETELAKLQRRNKELSAENKERREALEAMETTFLTETYGEDALKDNAELLEGLSFSKQKTLLGKLKPAGSEAAPATGTEPAPKAEEAEPPAPGAKAVTRGPAPGTSPANAHVEASAKELGSLAKTDPAAFYAALDAKYGDEVPTA